MVRQLFLRIFACILVLGPSVMNAADDQSEDFCILASNELLAAVDGSWVLTQHAGAASAAGMVIPLPPNPGQTVNIVFDIERGAAVMSASGQEMLLIPTAPGALQNALQFMNESEAEGLLQIGSGCNFYDLPLVLGSNRYNLATESIQLERGYAIGFTFGGSAQIVCVSQAAYDATVGEPTLSEPDDMFGSETQYFYFDGDRRPTEPDVVLAGGNGNICSLIVSEMPSPSPGELVMSLAVKFQTPNSATGMLYFEGKKNGHFFAAKAPVTLSR